MFFGGFLRWSNYHRKKRYSHLPIGWNVWGFHELGLFRQAPWSNHDRKKRYNPLAISCNVGLFWRVCRSVFRQVPWSNYKLRPEIKGTVGPSTPVSFTLVPPASSSLSKSIRKVSIKATCRLEWHYQLSKIIMAFSLSNIEIQWFFIQVDT